MTIGSGWTCTDIDNKQYGRKISDNIFEYQEDRGGVVYQEVVDITQYRYSDIANVMMSYGYDLLDEYYLDGYSQDDSKMLIAECLFESVT
jgi:hypothetical protein